MQKPKERILLLIQEIENHNFNYYIKNNPLISDYEYDLLIRDLEDLESQYPEFIQSNLDLMKLIKEIKIDGEEGGGSGAFNIYLKTFKE